jgi:hypothetical protein
MALLVFDRPKAAPKANRSPDIAQQVFKNAYRDQKEQKRHGCSLPALLSAAP